MLPTDALVLSRMPASLAAAVACYLIASPAASQNWITMEQPAPNSTSRRSIRDRVICGLLLGSLIVVELAWLVALASASGVIEAIIKSDNASAVGSTSASGPMNP